jgi:hypothetical protein
MIEIIFERGAAIYHMRSQCIFLISCNFNGSNYYYSYYCQINDRLIDVSRLVLKLLVLFN